MQITKIRNESKDITSDNPETKRITKKYSEQLYANKLNNLENNEQIIFFLFRAAPAAYGGPQDRGRIGALAAGLHHSQSNTGSDLCL